MKEDRINPTEKKTISKMIEMYCIKHHQMTESILCDDCIELKKYALKKLSVCKFGDNKPACKKCTIHCYNPEMKEKIRKVMRYSGPRIVLVNPILAFKHMLKFFYQDSIKE